MRKFSVVIPVFNRADELEELLECLIAQTLTDFDVLVVEDASTKNLSDTVVDRFLHRLEIHYISLPTNLGQGFARNAGLQEATGEWLIVLDSDALLPSKYLEIVQKEILQGEFDLYGGPDRDHPDFSPLQKAISYAMTSFFTTGGIRGGMKNLGGNYEPRSFNMGMKREVFLATGGFRITRMGEDIIFAHDARAKGFKSFYLEDAFIFHKRRNNWTSFAKQLKFFGRARINISRFHPETLKIVHFFPALFLLGLIGLTVSVTICKPVFYLIFSGYLAYTVLLFLDALRIHKSLKIACLGVAATYVQLCSYGTGFLSEWVVKLTQPNGTKNTGETTEYPT